MRRVWLALVLALASVSAHAAGDPLSAGYLSTSGNQINDASGNHVRLACISYGGSSGNASTDMGGIRSAGFNCVRVPWYDATLNLAAMDAVVSAAAASNIRVIFDHHGNEADQACLGQQSNGVWYDKNDNATIYNTTDGTDGCGTTGTVTYAAFKINWLSIATHYAGNVTVIGFDLHHEPLTYGSGLSKSVGWGTGDGSDAQAMCQDVGTAINGADPGALIICEGPISNNATLFSGALQNVTLTMDLSNAGTHPVTIANKVVYSVHSYPTDISASSPDSGTAAIAAMNSAWGYLVTQGIAPVWIGAMGASLDGTTGNLADEQAWAATMVAYANGLSGGSGGPVFTGTQQGISTNWHTFGHYTNQIPNGISNADGSLKAGQQAYWSQLLYHVSGSIGTTWNPGDISTGLTLSGGGLVATSTGTGSVGVRTTTSKSNGKACIAVVEAVATNNSVIAISTSADNLASFPGSYGGSSAAALYTDYTSQPVYVNGAVVASGAAGNSVNGDQTIIALDATAQRAWFSNRAMVVAGLPWDNSATDNPVTGVGGISLSFIQPPYFIEANTYDAGSVFTLNPTPTGCPTGFPAWDTALAKSGRPISVILGGQFSKMLLPVGFLH